MELMEGYKKTVVGYIPDDWKLLPMGKLFDFKNGVNADKSAYGSGVKFINVMDVFGGNEISYNSIKGKVQLSKDQIKTYRVSKGDILFNRTSETFEDIALASIYIDNKVVVFGGFVIRGSHLGQDLYPSFTQSILRSNRVRKQIISLSQGAIRANIGQADLSKVLLPVPSPSEQHTIAKVLSDTDKLIQSSEKKIAKKKLIKQGVMQKLLTPKEGWTEVVLRDFLLESPKYGINEASTTFDYNLPTYIRITDITEDGTFSKKNRVSINSQLSHLYYLDVGDIVFARTGASTGKSYLYDPNDGQLVYAGFLIKVTPDQSKLHSQYLKYYTESKSYWDWVKVMSMRSGQPGINGMEYASLKIAVPKTIEDQQEICQILNELDAEIKLLSQQTHKFHSVKQGLMQQLLTGKIRLPCQEK